MASKARPIPTEEQEQRTVAEWLDIHGILWCHVANEGRHHVAYRRKMASLGLRPGVPDILVFDPPRLTPPDFPKERMCPDCKGVAIELKRRKGGKVSQCQKEWIRLLNDRGWYAVVCRGADEAIRTLEELGYGRRSG